MRTLLLVVALLGLLAAAPMAQAQKQHPTLIAEIAPADDAIGAHNATSLRARAELVIDSLSASTAMGGIPVEYHVVSAPEWASVVISPTTDVFHFGSPHVSTTTSSQLMLTIAIQDNGAAPDAPRIGELVIEARTQETWHVASVSTTVAQLVTRAETEPCRLQEPAAAEPAAAQDDLVVQSGSAATIAPTPWVVVALGGMAAAGVAAYARRRASR